MGMTGLPPGEFSLISPGTKIPGQVRWKDGDRGGPAQTQNPLGGKRKTDLTLTGLLMEGLGE
jgi:hypothetical protein